MLDNIILNQLITLQQYAPLLTILKTLGDITTTHYNNSGTTVTKVSYSSLTFSLTEKSITISGSLPKFLFGNNQVNITYEEVLFALSKIQQLLQIDLSTADFKRIDIAYNFQMQQPVGNYFSLLVSKDHTKRWSVADESLYFRSRHGMESNFYNKNVEVRDNGQLIIPDNENTNLLRYEMRLKSGVTKKLGLKKLTFQDLFNLEVYRKIILLWYTEYRNILKLSYETASNIGSNLSSFKRYLMMTGIEKIGASEVFNLVKSHRPFSAVTRTRSNIRKLLKELIGEMHIHNSADALSELDGKMLAVFEDAFC